MQDCSISIANALEILQSCTKPTIWLYHCIVLSSTGVHYITGHCSHFSDFVQDNYDYTPWGTDPDSKDHGANIGPTWVLSAPGGPNVGPMNLAFRGGNHTISATPLPVDQHWQWGKLNAHITFGKYFGRLWLLSCYQLCLLMNWCCQVTRHL